MGIAIGPLHMRRSIFIRATPARVWQEFETTERLKAWFGTGHELVTFEPEVGGKVDIDIGVVRNDLQGRSIDQPIHCIGSVLVLEPEREITFQTYWEPGEKRAPTLWTLRLTPVYDGTLVEVIHHGYERFGKDAAAVLQGNEEGWDVHHLTALRSIVEN